MSRFQATRSKPNRTLVFLYNRIRSSKILLGALLGTAALLVISLLVWLYQHTECYSREAGIVWKEGPVHDLSRTCPRPSYKTIPTTRGVNATDYTRICLTTLTDSQSNSIWQRMLRCRDFDQVQKLTLPNQYAYAVKHGYSFRDGSFLIDTSRPPAWSKIRAVQYMMDKTYFSTTKGTTVKLPTCDWIFWMDADVVIMNSEIKVESLLPEDPRIDLIVTYDRRFTANSGAWLIRNSEWSKQFLNEWWNMKSWVRRPGLSLSGDNAAFGHLVKEKLQQQQENQENDEDHDHIQMIPRCNFNSFGVFLTETELLAMERTNTMTEQEWYMSDKFYHKGDFIAHASGIDQKAAGVEMLLARAT